MTFNITSSNVGILTRAGNVSSCNEVRITFTGAIVREVLLSGKRYRAGDLGEVVIPISDLSERNAATAVIIPIVDGEEQEIILEEFGYDAREKRIKPLWNREIVAGFYTIGFLADKIDRISKQVRALQKRIEPADNDLCI